MSSMRSRNVGQLLEEDLGHGTEYISAILEIVCACVHLYM